MSYIRIFISLIKINFQNQTVHGLSFFLAFIGKALRMVLLIVFLQGIFHNTAQVAGWTYDQAFLLTLTFLTVQTLAEITFHRNLLYFLPDRLRKGDFDSILTKPVNSLFLTSFYVVDAMDITQILTLIVLWLYYAIALHPVVTFAGVVLYLFCLLLSYVFVYALVLAISASAFWTINTSGAGRLVENIIRTAQFPIDIFRGALLIIFSYVVPIAIIATVPARALLGIPQLGLLLYSVVFTGLFLFVSLRIWSIGLRRYSSASS